MPSAGQNLFGINATLKYPKIVVPQFHPDDYLFQMKPCAINSVQYDYNPGGNPSFFKNTGGPTQVRMTVNLTEIEYWLQEDLR